MSKVEKLLEMLGNGTGPEGFGGTDLCVCPSCGAEIRHVRGMPCNAQNCPICGSSLTGKATIGSKA